MPEGKTMTTKSYIGKSLYVSAGLPATNDAAGFQALTWTKVNGLQTLPQVGVSHAAIDVPDLETGFTIGLKGAGTGVDTQMSFRIVASDTGQGLLKTASDGVSGIMSVKIVRATTPGSAPVQGDPVEYAQGFVHSYAEVQGTDTAHEGFTVNFRQNAPSVKATEPAP
jgi:hypothetical protein